MKKYLAGAVKYSYWFAESNQFISWMLEDKTDTEIIEIVESTNFLGQQSVDRMHNMSSRILKRIHALPKSVVEMYDTLDTDNQRIAILFGIMRTDNLIHDFIIDCFRPAVILGDQKLDDVEVENFFSKLQADSPDAARWTDATIHRLESTIRNYLRESGLVKGDNDSLLLQRVLLDSRLVRAMQEAGLHDYVLSITGRENG